MIDRVSFKEQKQSKFGGRGELIYDIQVTISLGLYYLKYNFRSPHNLSWTQKTTLNDQTAYKKCKISLLQQPFLTIRHL